MGMWMIAIAVSWICPGCATFLRSVDELGRCPACRLPAVRLDAARVSWYRCEAHRAWHGAPCGQPCTEVVCPALPEPPTRWTPWCPECRTFNPATAEDGACLACRRPPVIAPSRYRSWFWCSTGERWRDDRCPDDEVRRCCSERAGLYLAGGSA